MKEQMQLLRRVLLVARVNLLQAVQQSAMMASACTLDRKAYLPEQVLEGFQALLHEFRTLQQELGPWTSAFHEQHARKPRLADVEKTGDLPPPLPRCTISILSAAHVAACQALRS